MPRSQEIGADVFAASEQVARRFFLLGWDVDRGQGAGSIQNGELRRIAPVRFDPHARAARNERRGDHVTRHLTRLKTPLQLEAARPGFVAAPHGSAATDPIDESADRRQIWRELMDRRRPLTRQEDRGHH